MKTNKDIAPQSRNILEKFVWWGYKLSPHHTTAVNFRNFAYVYLCSLKTFHFQTWQVHGNCPTFFSNRSNLNRIKTWKAKTPQSEFVTWLLANSPFWVSSEGSPQKNVQEAKQKGEGKELELAMITVGFLFTLRRAKWNTIGKKMKSCQLLLLSLFSFPPSCLHLLYKDAAWPSGQCIRLTIWQSRVQVPLWSLAGFVLSCPEFKSSATLVKSQLVASCQLGFFNPVMLYYFELFDSKSVFEWSACKLAG